MPNTTAEAWATIYGDFVAFWAGRTPVHMPNTDFKPPAVKKQDEAPAVWVRPRALDGEALQRTAQGQGRRLWRHPGVLTVQVFTQKNRGDAAARSLAAALEAHYQGHRIDGVLFKAVSTRAVGEHGEWYQVNISIPYEWDSIS